MASLLDRSHLVPEVGRVRLRLPHTSDAPELSQLLERLERAGAGQADVRRALRWVPGRHAVVCATRWQDGRERLVGFAERDLPGGQGSVVALDPAVTGLLERALDEEAERRLA